MDAAESAKNLGGKALKYIGIGLKETAKLVAEGLSPSEKRNAPVYDDDELVRLPKAQKVPPKFVRADSSAIQKFRQPTRAPGSNPKRIVPNPFPAHVSEELGIPHRAFLTQREVELIQKDMRRY